MDTLYAIGIDLGTSNSALALAALDGSTPSTPVQIVTVEQLTSATTSARNTTLPSALYLCTEPEQRSFATLAWQEQTPAHVIGQFANDHGFRSPQRLVTSAKSWLCQHHHDPQKPLLPWQSQLDNIMLSPFEAQVQLLRHLRSALLDHPDYSLNADTLSRCKVTITVPASFDEVARILTAEAATEAGWGEVALLEEQQAAFYHWLDQSGEQWRQQISAGEIILVCDVGGGTADFSLIAVSDDDGELQLERISVGDHILLGGDNMDLALAYTLKAELEGRGTKIDSVQFSSLTLSCRRGKEQLFDNDELQSYPISIPSRGSSLFAKTITSQLSREQLTAIVLEGFLPLLSIDEQPTQRPQSGLQESGLNYATDPVLSKHLAQFLVRSQINYETNAALSPLNNSTQGQHNGLRYIRPSAVLFNGGVFKSQPIRRRVVDILQQFNDDVPLRELGGANFDLAVAKGAAFYTASITKGDGIRIKAGTARSYYIGLESSMPAIPGLIPALKALCVVPQGMEEGAEFSLTKQQFGLMTGQPVDFRFFSSSVRAGDVVGDQLETTDELEETSQLEITLPSIAGQPSQRIPVTLHSHITDLGTLELWMQHDESGQRWKIEFNVRGH
ncbi:MAG: hypothetical protein B6I37_05435 [Desulfobacteraceae bacterium 4572_35.2]|nr:MAG: hypothetical protein B6I37_05435 [Desulfobacteraceae bacterium 4572_35.2]